MIPSVETANAYHELRNNSAWTDVDDNAKAPALYRAADYIYATYRVDGHEDDVAVLTAITMLAPEMLDAPARVQAGEREVLSEESGYGNGAVETKVTYAKSDSDDPYPLISAKLASYGKRRDAPYKSGNSLTIWRRA